MKILFATTNKAKIKFYAEELKKEGFDIITLADLNLNINVVEDGNSPIENAKKKAKGYYDAAKILTIALDDGLYIDGLDDDKQPGTNIRRVNGKVLNDQELVDYYIDIVKNLGGRATARYKKGIAIYDGKEFKTKEIISIRTFIDKQCNKVDEGYPLDSITYWDEFKKYTSELSDEEKNKAVITNQVVDFLKAELMVKI